jgi:AcrR family transcriptional regulator
VWGNPGLGRVGTVSAEPIRRSGRRSGDSGTRAAILDAAREEFATHGYQAATMRSIAAAADVDPALIRHFFGPKDALFAATVEFPQAALDGITEALQGDRDGLGERVTRTYLRLWDDPATSAPLQTMFRSVVSSEQAANLLREFLTGRVLGSVVPLLGPDRPELRITLATSHLMGMALARYVLRVAPLADAGVEELVATIGPAIQRYLTAPLGD